MSKVSKTDTLTSKSSAGFGVISYSVIELAGMLTGMIWNHILNVPYGMLDEG